MSHYIDETTGNAAVFVTGEPAWHQLGTVIEKAADSAEAIKLAHLDWEVEQWPLFAHCPDDLNDERYQCPSRVANVRSDTRGILGVVGSGYRVFQNAEAFDFMDTIVGEKLAMYETAGALKDGRVVWMLARIPKELRAGKNDEIRPYVLLTNSHDGSQALRMIPTSVRVVCWNTLSLAIEKARDGYLSIWHTQSLEDRVKQARANLGIITKAMGEHGEKIQQLVAKALTLGEAGDYFGRLFPVEGENAKKSNAKALDQVFGNFDNQRNTLPGIKHTAWAAYNSVSEYCDHQRRVTGKGVMAQAEQRVRSNWFGTSHKIKQVAFAEAIALAS